MNHKPNNVGLILFAHGSSRAAWRAPLEQLRAGVAAQVDADVLVSLAFLEQCSPTLQEAAREAAAKGVTRLEILPLFISGGGHVQRDLPPLLEQVQRAHPDVTVLLHPAIGGHPAIVTAIAGLLGHAAAQDL